LGAFCLSGGQSPENRLLETLGGIAAGSLGGGIPDRIDPPTSPNHRGFGHGLLFNGAVATAFVTTYNLCVEKLRNNSDICRATAENSTDLWQKILCWIACAGWRLLAGALSGLALGWVSHLVLDSRTPRGLPLIGKIQ
jgi:membrane-bound metal-dependent hydrolase YbcI (DUF457 family)